MLLEKWKYVVKEKKMPEYITDDIETSSDSDREDSDEEIPNEKKKKILMKKIKYRMCSFFVFEEFQIILGYS